MAESREGAIQARLAPRHERDRLGFRAVQASCRRLVGCAPVTTEESSYDDRRPWWSRLRVLVAIVGGLALVGIVLVEWPDRGGVGPRLVTDLGTGDHWHVAFGVYHCDRFVDRAVVRGDDWPDPSGIHSHNDDVIHIHPFIESAAGDRARLGVFFETMGLTFTDQAVEMTNGTTLRSGDRCAGQPATLQVAVFDPAAFDRPPKIVTTNLPSIRLRDGQAMTIALVPEDASIPLPPVAANLGELAATSSTTRSR